MLRMRMGSTGRARSVIALLAAAVAVSVIATAPADARPRKRAPMHGWHAGYAAIVVDAKTGKVLHETKADAVRHPASLTKIMTLYLLFEQLESGKLKLGSKLKVSARAAEQAPSKLGLDEDDTIAVDSAIKALVTRSANDVAVTIAEAIAGSEESFARLMTKKARALGMRNTTFKNASGLPDSEQVTTARDLALLGRAIQDRFPRYYGYFAIKSFVWNGVGIRNHNRLLGQIVGLDGIKTGYTRASGFNLVSSVRSNNRHLVAVVLGGNSAAVRDARMRELIRTYLPRAYAGTRTAPNIVETPEAAPARVTRVAATRTDTPVAPVATPVATTSPALPPPSPGSSEPIRPRPVKVFVVGKVGEPAPAAPGTLGVLLGTSLMTPTGVVAQPLQIAPAATPRPVPANPAPIPVAAPTAAPAPAPATAPAAPAASVTVSAPVPPTAPASPAPRVRSGWQIQIGAFPEERQARDRLDAARSRLSSLLGRADPYTEATVRGSTTLFRARFAGLDEDSAKRACALLKKSEFACMAFKN